MALRQKNIKLILDGNTDEVTFHDGLKLFPLFRTKIEAKRFDSKINNRGLITKEIIKVKVTKLK